MDVAELKRQILINSEQTGIRKRVTSQGGLDSNEIIEMGQALEEMAKTRGWAYIEAYILKNSDPIGLLFHEEDPVRKGESRALVKLMQYVDQIIKAKNDILKNEEK
jgi:hypothetical protein